MRLLEPKKQIPKEGITMEMTCWDPPRTQIKARGNNLIENLKNRNDFVLFKMSKMFTWFVFLGDCVQAQTIIKEIWKANRFRS